MEGYFLHISKKLHEIRFKPGTVRLLELSELKVWSFWRAVMAEFLATLLFAFAGLLSGISLDGTPNDSTQDSFGWGLAVMAVNLMFGNISGALINPAPTIALATVGEITPVRGFFYIIAEFGGAVTGSFILKGVTPSTFHDSLGVNRLRNGITIGQAFGIEIIMTFVLVFVAMATIDPNRTNGGNQSFIIGITVVGLNLTGDTFTGTSINPAKSLGSAVASNNYVNLWIFFLGPILGALAAALSYTYIFSPYRQWNQSNTKVSVDDAISTLLQDGGPIVIPNDYFLTTTRY